MSVEPGDEIDFDEWVTPLSALGVSDSRMADEHEMRSILERLKGGALVAVARNGWHYGDGGEHQYDLVRVPSRAWRSLDRNDEAFFWNSGDLVAESVTDSFRFFDIRFHPDAFSGSGAPIRAEKADPVALANAAVKTVLEHANRNPGGRPKKDFWEDLLIEMFDRLWHGTLVPKVQADIEDAMADWLSANDKAASERSIRQRAQRLWKVWIKEGNN